MYKFAKNFFSKSCVLKICWQYNVDILASNCTLGFILNSSDDDIEDVAGEDSNNQSANSGQQRTANQSAAVRSVANHSEVSC